MTRCRSSGGGGRSARLREVLAGGLVALRAHPSGRRRQILRRSTRPYDVAQSDQERGLLRPIHRHILARTMNLKRVVAAVGRLPVVSSLIRQPLALGLLKNVPGAKLLYGSGWDAVHPFDRLHRTHTSGFVSADQLPAQEAARAHAVFYAGSQPSVLREGLRALPSIQTCTFVDLGCGKGRPLLVPSAFPFLDILGVELSPFLASVA